MAKIDDYDEREDIGWFRDELRQRDRTIAELRSELDEANSLNRRWSENYDDYLAVLETFDMELTDEGWSWKPFWDEYQKEIIDYCALVKRYNKLVPLVRGPQDVGRPLNASEAQVVTVLKLHKQGKSLRWISDETSLGLQTVRTIIGRNNGTDRTTKKRWDKIERVEIDKFKRAHWKSRKRSGDALPKRVEQVVETGKALAKESKGLGGGR